MRGTDPEGDDSARNRVDAAQIREANAVERDRAAADRDVAADTRDRLAATLDDALERQASAHASGRGGRDRAGVGHDRASDRRDAAADDRASAARDRLQGAADRSAAAADLAIEGIDYLTGVQRRRTGLAAIQREMDRATRSSESLVVAFVDVDGLKAINDTLGHAAADDVLREVARCLTGGLRSYDAVVRYGGDEFVCSVAGQGLAGVQARFREISTRLSTTHGGPTVTVGLAQHRPEERLGELVARADAAMIDARSPA
jgi:diguanylate cyclase (GGDEF)-like protein